MQENQRLSDLIAQRIGDIILSGEIDGGSQLRQEELASQLEVSRIPIREALLQLENSGLVVQLDTRRVYASRIDRQSLQEVFSIIAELEKKILERIKLSDELLQQKLKEEGELGFHRYLYQNTENAFLSHELKNATDYYIRYALKNSEGDIQKILLAMDHKNRALINQEVDLYFNRIAGKVIEKRNGRETK